MMPEDSDREVAGILALVAVVFWLVGTYFLQAG